jgi:DNA-binding NtrC family response regulator
MTILVVEDHAETRRELVEALRTSGDGWDVREAPCGKDGLDVVRASDLDCVLLDYRLPDVDGLTCLAEIRKLRPDVPVVIVTGEGSETVAVRAMKLGAADYVVKQGMFAQAVPGIVREVLGRRALARLAADPGERDPSANALPPLDPAMRARFAADGFITRSPAMLRVLALVARAAQSTATVLIEGESGTGKELLARALHAYGPRAERPFVAQNCAAVPESLLESELFGHARGAFTGADRARPGLFEQAEGGTLFLDEIGEAGPSIQAKLLRVLQEREVRPIGSTGAPRRLNVRIVSATNRDLRRESMGGEFRLDLLHRLRVFPLVVPPLRERPEDVAPLAERFLEEFAREEGKPVVGFEPETVAAMERYSWPGNVRELQNEVRRLVVAAAPGARIAPTALAPAVVKDVLPTTVHDAPLRDVMRQLETAVVQGRLRKHGYKRAATARSLGLSRSSLWGKLRRLGIVPPGSDDDEEA